MKCEVIRDLLPLYSEGLTSSDSNELVREHLTSCHECNEILNNINKKVEFQTSLEPTNTPEQMLFQRIRKRTTTLIAISIITAIFIGMSTEIYIFGFLAWGLLGTAVLSLVWNVENQARWYFVAALSTYIFSVLASFSIGIYTLSIAFILFAIAVSHLLKFKKRWQLIIAGLLGFGIWLLLVRNVDDYWLFFPISLFFR